MSVTKTMALSHSRLSDFNQCPRKFYLKYIQKDDNFKIEDGSPHLVRGRNVHKALENYIVDMNAGATDIPTTSLQEVERTKPLINEFFRNYPKILPEAQVSIDANWQQVEWFSRSSYYRAIFDMICISESMVFVGDFKTGKKHDYTPESGYGQLELSAAMALNLWPDVPKVQTAYLYVDHKEAVRKDFTQADKPRLVEWFDKESIKVNAATEYPPTTNQFCKWCPATKVQCPYSRKL